MEIQNWQSEDGKIKLFRCHCMALMKLYPDRYFDLVISDPPYGNASDAVDLGNKKTNTGAHLATRKEYTEFNNSEPPDEEYFKELRRISKDQIVWGGNFFGLKGGVIAWNKNGTAFGEGEVAICSTHASVRFFEFTWNGMIQGDMKNKEIRIHTTQKPVQLYKYCLLNYAKSGFKILDTHLGSASIAVAIDQINKIDGLNLELTACELVEDIYYSALERVQNAVKTEYAPLFKEQNVETFQQSLFDEKQGE
jgi:site-specific DNA-methyltransferase (adenine-specific)